MNIDLPLSAYWFGAAFLICIVLTFAGMRLLAAHPVRSMVCCGIVLVISFFSSLAAPAVWIEWSQVLLWSPEMGLTKGGIEDLTARAKQVTMVVCGFSFICFGLGLTLGALVFRRLRKEVMSSGPND